MDKDTELGGPARGFPATGVSLIARVRDMDPSCRRAAFSTLISAYWKPVYKYIRIHWRASNEDAKDWTQDFFAHALEKDYLQRYDPARTRFRTYLRTCIDGFVANQLKSASRLKRGGQIQNLPLDCVVAESELLQGSEHGCPDPEELFHREWVRSLFQLAVEDLRESCRSSGRGQVFEVFSRYDLEPSAERLTYGQLGADLGLSAVQVTNYLASARRQFRELVLQRLRDLCATESEFQAEARHLFGAEPKCLVSDIR